MSDKKRNLDWLAAHHAQEINKALGKEKASDVDNIATKALGVLQEDGIYACALFLLSRSGDEKDRAGAVMGEILKLLAALDFGWGEPSSRQPNDVLKHLSDRVTSDSLERLLLAKETLEQMLIYTRYGAKARGKEG